MIVYIPISFQRKFSLLHFRSNPLAKLTSSRSYHLSLLRTHSPLDLLPVSLSFCLQCENTSLVNYEITHFNAPGTLPTPQLFLLSTRPSPCQHFTSFSHQRILPSHPSISSHLFQSTLLLAAPLLVLTSFKRNKITVCHLQNPRSPKTHTLSALPSHPSRRHANP